MIFDPIIICIGQQYRGLLPCSTISEHVLFSLRREVDGEQDKRQIWYYSTKAQLQELMERLDQQYWETDLHATLEEIKEEVQAHMAITEDLTNKARGNNRSYLSAADGTHRNMDLGSCP